MLESLHVLDALSSAKTPTPSELVCVLVGGASVGFSLANVREDGVTEGGTRISEVMTEVVFVPRIGYGPISLPLSSAKAQVSVVLDLGHTDKSRQRRDEMEIRKIDLSARTDLGTANEIVKTHQMYDDAVCSLCEWIC